MHSPLLAAFFIFALFSAQQSFFLLFSFKEVKKPCYRVIPIRLTPSTAHLELIERLIRIRHKKNPPPNFGKAGCLFFIKAR